MRDYNYDDKWQSLLTPQIVSLLTSIHEYKGEQTLFIEASKDRLNELIEIAKIQSTDASNKIEGIYTSDDRLKQIVLDKTVPKTRNEEEIAGYRDVLNSIHMNYEYIPVRPTYILQLHRDLYKFSGLSFGGKFKASDNIIAEIDAYGNKKTRFQPVPSWEVANAMEELCAAYGKMMISNSSADSLLIIPMFILDFLCIHPFDDGNGRLSRLMTLLLLYQSDYIVGKYISIEKLIEKSKETYYEVLQRSSVNWHENCNDYAPFVEYMLGVIVAAYREFSSRIELLVTSGLSKPERIRETIKNHMGRITKIELMKQCPDISQTTIQRTLNELLGKEDIVKIGGGRYTSYIWNAKEMKK